jgi:hypothetical protein
VNRRGFLSFLSAAATAPLVPVPELLLPTRTIFLPPVGGWRGNGLLSIDLIAKEALRFFHQEMEFMATINRDYDASFGRGDQWPSSVIKAHRPVRYEFNLIKEEA